MSIRCGCSQFCEAYKFEIRLANISDRLTNIRRALGERLRFSIPYGRYTQTAETWNLPLHGRLVPTLIGGMLQLDRRNRG